MDAKRTSEVIDKEIQELRGKLRALEGEKQEHTKALEKTKADRKRSAYSAHSDKDAKAQERLAKARAAQRESEFALEDLESAIAEGKARFDALQAEHEQAYRAEEWEKVLALAAEAMKEAKEFDTLMNGVIDFFHRHAATLETMRKLGHGAGHDLSRLDARHVVRVLFAYLFPILPQEINKPAEQYRKAYAEIFKQAWEGAVRRAQTQAEGSGQDHEAEAQGEAGATG